MQPIGIVSCDQPLMFEERGSRSRPTCFPGKFRSIVDTTGDDTWRIVDNLTIVDKRVRITEVEAIVLRQPEVDEGIADGSQDDLVILVHTHEGIAGIGAVDSSPE